MTVGTALERETRSAAALLSFMEGCAAVAHANKETELLSGMCRTLVERGGYPLACILRAGNDAGRTLRPIASHGIETSAIELLHRTRGPSDPGLLACATAVHTARPVTHTYAANPSASIWRGMGTDIVPVSHAAIPLNISGAIFGAIVVASADPDAFGHGEVERLVEFADMLGSVLNAWQARNEAHLSTLQSNLTDTVQALATALEFHDPYTASHSRHVAALSVAIAQEMNLSAEEIAGLRFAALLHDIGKIAVPLEICCKPGRLIVHEIRLLQTHADAGYAILKGIPFPWPIATMVLQHHERLDGSGYPQGTKGNDILLGARIIGVADVVEAMMSHRPYRAALGQAAAIAEIVRGRGVQYDASVVDACLAIARRPGFNRLVLGCDATIGTEFSDEASVRPDTPDPPATTSPYRTNPPRLTLQQSTAIQLLADGKSVKEIARHMNIGIGTVKAHLSIAYKALGARNRMEAVVQAGFHAIVGDNISKF